MVLVFLSRSYGDFHFFDLLTCNFLVIYDMVLSVFINLSDWIESIGPLGIKGFSQGMASFNSGSF